MELTDGGELSAGRNSHNSTDSTAKHLARHQLINNITTFFLSIIHIPLTIISDF